MSRHGSAAFDLIRSTSFGTLAMILLTSLALFLYCKEWNPLGRQIRHVFWLHHEVLAGMSVSSILTQHGIYPSLRFSSRRQLSTYSRFQYGTNTTTRLHRLFSRLKRRPMSAGGMAAWAKSKAHNEQQTGVKPLIDSHPLVFTCVLGAVAVLSLLALLPLFATWSERTERCIVGFTMVLGLSSKVHSLFISPLVALT